MSDSEFDLESYVILIENKFSTTFDEQYLVYHRGRDARGKVTFDLDLNLIKWRAICSSILQYFSSLTSNMLVALPL